MRSRRPQRSPVCVTTVNLSSYGAHVPEGTGPVTGLHSSEEKLIRHRRFACSATARRVLHGEHLTAISMIQGMGIFGHALPTKPEAAHDRDGGMSAEYAAQRLLDLDFSGKQTRELLGERDLSMAEATTIIARGIGKPDLHYEQFPYDQVQQVLEQMGMSPKKAAVYIEMFNAINAGVLAAQEPRSRENTTSTSFEKFVHDVFAPAYHGKARTAQV